MRTPAYVPVRSTLLCASHFGFTVALQLSEVGTLSLDRAGVIEYLILAADRNQITRRPLDLNIQLIARCTSQQRRDVYHCAGVLLAQASMDTTTTD